MHNPYVYMCAYYTWYIGMGPKIKRSTEGAQPLHILARAPGHSGVRLRSQTWQIVGLLWEGEGMQINHQQDGSCEAYGQGNGILRENHLWYSQRVCCLWWPTSHPCQKIHYISNSDKSRYFWQGSHPPTGACLVHQKGVPHLQCWRRPKRSAAFQVVDSAFGEY